MPKEVGKIGTESPTFVQPVQDRKDGIQAMFAKQQKQQSQPTATSGTNPTLTQRARKRSAPSPTDFKSSATTGESPTKKPKVEKLNTWEDDSDVEYVDDSPAAGGDGAGHGEDHKVRLYVRTPPRRLLILFGLYLQPSATLSTSKRDGNHAANDAHDETPPKVSSLPHRATIYSFWSRPLTSMFAVTGTERKV